MKRFFILILCILFNVQNVSAEPATLVVDVNKLKVLHQCNAKQAKYPASLTKMMTLYLVFDALTQGKITMNSKISVSKQASLQQPSKLHLKPGETITVKDAIAALIIKSANDVAYAVAESLGGNANSFVGLMNAKAKKLGMRNTHFVNPTGWHDSRQHTTAYDMAKLAISLRKYHAKYYNLFSKKEFLFKGKTIKTHNKVLLKCHHVDGIKTGFTNASGFNLVTSVKNKNANLVAVVMGDVSAKQRDQRMLNLISKFIRS